MEAFSPPPSPTPVQFNEDNILDNELPSVVGVMPCMSCRGREPAAPMLMESLSIGWIKTRLLTVTDRKALRKYKDRIVFRVSNITAVRKTSRHVLVIVLVM